MTYRQTKFPSQPWEQAAPGLRLKQVEIGGKLLRLLEFSPDYDDQAWCEKGHAGYVVSGRIKFIFDAHEELYEQGDGFFIADGVAARHRSHIAPGEQAVLFIVEDGGDS